MAKLNLLLLDANVIIEAHRQGIWEELIQKCDITITEAVKDECKFWIDSYGQKHNIEMYQYINSGQIQCVEVGLNIVQKFIGIFDISYVDRLDPGEAESLAFLFNSDKSWLISSSDSIVYRILGTKNRVDQGLSLEEILSKIGMTKSLDWQFTKKFRIHESQRGIIDSIQDRGINK